MALKYVTMQKQLPFMRNLRHASSFSTTNAALKLTRLNLLTLSNREKKSQNGVS